MSLQNEMQKSLLRELELQRDFFSGKKMESVYFGGGTPSLLATEQINALLQQVRSIFPLTEQAEITLEANPDDLHAEKINELSAIGINRLSIGIQSFYEEDLAFMNRGHSASQAENCIPLAIENGISNISIDLIFGFPLLSHEKWAGNIARALSFPIQHISCYAMTIEPRTALANMIAKKKSNAADDAFVNEQYQYLINTLEHAGFEHYEISNFAKPGYRAKHNSSYWQGKPYLGIGPSAHSFRNDTRQWNIANNALYIKQIAADILPCEKEILSANDQCNEKIMLGLRTAEGLDLAGFKALLSVTQCEIFDRKIKKYADIHWIVVTDDGRIRLTRIGKSFADGIASDLFL